MLEEPAQKWNAESNAEILVKSFDNFGALWKGLMA